MGWLSNKIAEAYALTADDGIAWRLIETLPNLSIVLANPLPSLNPTDLLAGLAGAVLFYGIVWYRRTTAKKWRHDIEYGSARFGTAKDIAPYADQNPDNNMILTKSESITMSSRPKQPKYARNKNCLIIGGSGSGKTRFFVKPNIMQCISQDFPVSLVITDPNGLI